MELGPLHQVERMATAATAAAVHTVAAATAGGPPPQPQADQEHRRTHATVKNRTVPQASGGHGVALDASVGAHVGEKYARYAEYAAIMKTPSPTRKHRPLTPVASPMDVDSEYARTPSPLQRKTRCAPSSSSPPPPPPPAAPPRKPIVTVFDWDDTLCPSFWLYQHGVLAEQGLMAKTEHDGGAAMPSLSCGELRDKLARIETAALALLQLATQVGPVFIITAAKLAWVSACADAFLPHVKALLKTPSFHVVSAREWYQQQLRVEGTPLAWKVMTFDAVCAHLRVDDVYARTRQAVDFISVGDSVFERDACRTVHSKAPTMLHAKTLKFVEYPDADELLEQLKLTRDVFEQFCDYVGSLDLCVVRKDSNNQATAPSLELLQVTLPQPQPMPQTDSKSNDRHHHPRNHEHAHAHPHSHSHSPSHSYSNSPSHSQPARASAVQS